MQSPGGSYVWYARIAPMYITLLPVAIGIGVWFPETRMLEQISVVVLSPGVLAVLLGEKGRDRGRRKQGELWAKWGGPLLTQYLHHSNTDINQHLRLEYHQKLRQLLPNLAIPSSEEEETKDREGARNVYDACAQHMVNVVREDPKRYWSAFKENRSYGLRRNLWGLKPLGVTCSIVGAASAALALGLRWEGPETISAPWVVSILCCVGLFVFWCTVTPNWVRIANDAYVRRVLESLPRMGEQDALGTST